MLSVLKGSSYTHCIKNLIFNSIHFILISLGHRVPDKIDGIYVRFTIGYPCVNDVYTSKRPVTKRERCG